MELDKILEAILFWKGEPMTLPELCRALKLPSTDVRKALSRLKEGLKGHGLSLIETDDEFALATAPEASETIARLQKDELSKELGRAAVETLAIILYKNPVSRRDIDFIRGVNSTAILRSLLIRGLVERVPGGSDNRIFEYRPTVSLLSLLGIGSLSELPEFEAVKKDIEAWQAEQGKQSDAGIEEEPDGPTD